MQRFLDAILLGLAAIAAIYVLDSAWPLTAPIASQFGAGGRPGLAIYHAVMMANRSDPPRLPETFFWVLFCGFLVLCAFWGVGFYRSMRVPRKLTTGS